MIVQLKLSKYGENVLTVTDIDLNRFVVGFGLKEQ